MKMTIDSNGSMIVVHDENGWVISQHRTYCNPAGMRQAVLAAETHGEIDWENSQCEKPEWAE